MCESQNGECCKEELTYMMCEFHGGEDFTEDLTYMMFFLSLRMAKEEDCKEDLTDVTAFH